MLPASSHNYNIAYRRTHNTKEEKDRSVYSPPCGVCRLQQGGQHHHHHHLQHSHHHHGASLPPPHDSHCLTFRGLASSALAMMRPPNTTVRPHSSAPHCPASPVGVSGEAHDRPPGSPAPTRSLLVPNTLQASLCGGRVELFHFHKLGPHLRSARPLLSHLEHDGHAFRNTSAHGRPSSLGHHAS